MSYDNFKASLLDLFVKQKNCDVQFVCTADDADSKSSAGIMAHKLILSLASDVLYTMFYGEASKTETRDKKPIQIDDIQLSTFKLFLSFIYTKTVEFDTPETAAEFYYAAHKYNCIDALDFIKNYMLKEVNAENCTVFYAIAHLYENVELKEACIKIFTENTTDVLNSAKFLNAEPKTIEAIFKLDALNISSEKQLMDALERYIQHNIDDDKGIPEKVRPALSQIRFLTLTPALVAETTLLEPEDVVAVVCSLPPDGDVTKMPTFLSINANKRQSGGTNKEMIRKLNDVYSAKFCARCQQNHAIWYCPNGALDAERRTTIMNIYSKYLHVWLMDYEPQDIITIFEAYKVFNFVK